MQIEDALACFETQLKADGRSVLTQKSYRRHLHALVRWTAGERLSGHVEDLRHEHLASFLASPVTNTRPDGGKKTATSMNALRSSVRVFFRYLHEAGFVEVNPARLIKRAITTPSPPRALTRHEEERLLAVLAAAKGNEEERDAVLFRLLLGSGLRLSSALGLDVESVDLDEGVMCVRTKRDRKEQVFMAGRVRAELRAFIGERTSGPLFAYRTGRSISPRHAQRRFRALRERAGLSETISPHGLRHTFATRLLERTHDISLVQAALGHRSIASTLVYARVDHRRLREALA